MMMGPTQTLILLAKTGTFDLEREISSLSIRSVLIGTLVLTSLVLLAALIRTRMPKLKTPIFLLLVGTVLTTTVILIASTLYLNLKSSSGGPVHWHADFEIWACDRQLELRDPTGLLSNKIGTATLHEHNDKRIHLEGVVVEDYDATLGKFMTVIGGQITNNSLVVPLNNSETGVFKNGDRCSDSDNNEVQVFAYSTEDEVIDGKQVYRQSKLEDPATFRIAPESQVPKGDCIIIEFGPPRERTDHKCLQYQVQDEELQNYTEVE